MHGGSNRFITDRFSLCDRVGLNDALPLSKWISCGFTGVFQTPHLFKILDKVVAGSTKVLVYLALTLVEYRYKEILQSENSYEAIGRITSHHYDSKDAEELALIKTALDRWSKDGHQLGQAHQNRPPKAPQAQLASVLPPPASKMPPSDEDSHHKTATIVHQAAAMRSAPVLSMINLGEEIKIANAED